MLLLAEAASSTSEWLPALVSGLVVAVVTIIFQFFHERRLKALESKFTSKSGFFLRKLEKHEQVWPLIAECNRAQTTLAAQKRQGNVDYSNSAKQISEARKVLKNFVYDNGLYFDDRLRKLIQDLDTQLADTNVHDVRVHVESIEDHLRNVLNEIA